MNENKINKRTVDLEIGLSPEQKNTALEPLLNVIETFLEEQHEYDFMRQHDSISIDSEDKLLLSLNDMYMKQAIARMNSYYDYKRIIQKIENTNSGFDIYSRCIEKAVRVLSPTDIETLANMHVDYTHNLERYHVDNIVVYLLHIIAKLRRDAENAK